MNTVPPSHNLLRESRVPAPDTAKRGPASAQDQTNREDKQTPHGRRVLPAPPEPDEDRALSCGLAVGIFIVGPAHMLDM